MDASEAKSSVETTEERKQSTAEFIADVKERAALKEELAETTRELNKTKGQNYDLLKKLEKLEKENATLKKEVEHSHKGKRKKPVKRKIPRSKKHNTPKIDENEAFESTENLYEVIAELYPDLPLSMVLHAEKKFTEADANNDGTVDEQELEKMLDSTSLMFTKSEVKDILTTIDVDGTGSLDFLECLKVCNALQNNRKTGLPSSIQQNKSSVCSVQ